MTMLYKLTRTDRPDYDEYDEIVVRATSEGQARRLVCRTNDYGDPKFRGFRPDGSNVVMERIVTTGSPVIICSSFNAG